MPKHHDSRKHIVHHMHVVHHKKPRFNGSIVIVIIAIILIGAYLYLSNSGKLAATVNGEKIYQDRIDALYNSLPKGATLTKEDILQRLIDTKLLVAYIRNSGYGLSDEEFNAELKTRIEKDGTTLSELKKELSLNRATLEDVKESIEIEVFVNKVIIPDIQVSDSEIAAYRKSTSSTLTNGEIKKVLFTGKQRLSIAQIIENQRKTADIKIV